MIKIVIVLILINGTIFSFNADCNLQISVKLIVKKDTSYVGRRAKNKSYKLEENCILILYCTPDDTALFIVIGSANKESFFL